jgi:putative glutamine amidotransferase
MMDTSQDRVRVGIPYRTSAEEASGENAKHNDYCEAVRRAGGEPVAISLRLGDADLTTLLRSLDAFVLPGSPADVDPARYGTERRPTCDPSDAARERVDWAVFEEAFAANKPLLASCYGLQSLNVYLGGTLVQDIPSEVHGALRHGKTGLPKGSPAPIHSVRVEPGSKLADLAGFAQQAGGEINVNSTHHQSVLDVGRGLRVTATAPDGVIEAVEYTGGADGANSGGENWVVGVQWHPEHAIHESQGDRFSESLFRALVRAAAGVAPQAT